MFNKEDLLCEKLDIDEIDKYSIINVYTNDEDYQEQCISQDIDYSDRNCENCTNCYYSNGNHCSVYNIKICKLSPICWSYRDSITMRVSCDFQDNNDTY